MTYLGNFRHTLTIIVTLGKYLMGWRRYITGNLG